jgi:rhodanese-related sulfurtransferase
MKTDGQLLRLSKKDFVALLKEPMLKRISIAIAEDKVAAGAIWVDARLPSEFNYDHREGAVNLPLNEIRQLLRSLDKCKTYIAYCATGRRSSAVAFILVQHGFDAQVLNLNA